MPMYMDRHHRRRDQLRACMLPVGTLVDVSVSLHHVTHWASTALTYFLLGFWNSAVTEYLLTHAFMTPGCNWIRWKGIQNLPFPSFSADDCGNEQHLREAYRCCRHLATDPNNLRTTIRSLPRRVLPSMVSWAARHAQEARLSIMRQVKNATEDPRTRWMLFTGDESRHTGTTSPSTETLESFREHRKGFHHWSFVVDVALAELYEVSDDELGVMISSVVDSKMEK